MITNYAPTVSGPITLMQVSSSLSGRVFYNWFVDGGFVAQTQFPEYSFVLTAGQQVTCIDSNAALGDFNSDFSEDFFTLGELV